MHRCWEKTALDAKEGDLRRKRPCGRLGFSSYGGEPAGWWQGAMKITQEGRGVYLTMTRIPFNDGEKDSAKYGGKRSLER